MQKGISERTKGFKSTREVAKAYKKRGWKPIPARWGSQNPTIKGWQNTDFVPEDFSASRTTPQNICVQMGKPSHGLTDVDLDCPTARALAPAFLPETDAIFGRESAERSHWLYYTDLWKTAKTASEKFEDPEPKVKGKNDHGVCLVELRTGRIEDGEVKGVVSVFPGSKHHSGERIKWFEDGEPAQVDGAKLRACVQELAAAILLVEHYPAEGRRHDAALVLGGVLARAGFPQEEIEVFVKAVAKVAGDEEWQQRVNDVRNSAERWAAGEPTQGRPKLQEYWGDKVGDQIADWLGVGGGGNQAIATDADHQRIDELANLDALNYDRARERAAKQLGVRTSTLDKIVAQHREQRELAEVEAGFMQPVEPWPEPVDGAELVREIREVLRRHIVTPKGGSITIALWIIHAHAHEAAQHSPILFINSPTKQCGKTNLLGVIARLVPKPMSAANITQATVFRAIDRWRPTMLVDEMDTFLSDKSELRGILNSGHTRSGAYVVRCVGDDLIPKQFSTWAPKAFAAIGRMHPTLEDRAIKIELKRRLPSEPISHIPKDPDAYLDLHRRCVRWVSDHLIELMSATPAMPEGLNDRVCDNWYPLMAVASLCSPRCVDDATSALIRASGAADDESYSEQLLQDIKELFAFEKGHNLSSRDLAYELGQMEARPWPEFRHGQTITAAGIATQVRVRGAQAQGYALKQFKRAFERYAPSPRTPDLPPDTPDKAMGSRAYTKKKPDKEGPVSGCKIGVKPLI